jgi:hypothetical protein
MLGRGMALLWVGLLACGGAEPPDPPEQAAPAGTRAALVFEPPQVAVGEVSEVEIAVTTPPGHRVRPPAPPEALDGVWIIGIEPPRLEKQPGRWVHRMQVRLRAREVGEFIWPASRVAVESPDGQVREIELEERPFQVVSVFPEFPQQRTPFGLETAPAREGPGVPALVAGAAGAGLALSGVAAVALVRRRARARPGQTPSRPALPPSWEEARQALDAAAAGLNDDPVATADCASAALRRYVTRRFGPDAIVRTTEELAAARPPRGARSRWPVFVELLQRLDSARFRGAAVDREALAATLAEAHGFVVDSTPPEGLR